MAGVFCPRFFRGLGKGLWPAPVHSSLLDVTVLSGSFFRVHSFFVCFQYVMSRARVFRVRVCFYLIVLIDFYIIIRGLQGGVSPPLSVDCMEFFCAIFLLPPQWWGGLLEGLVMRRRSRMSRGSSKRLFSNRSGVHPRNSQNAVPMRGGIRL